MTFDEIKRDWPITRILWLVLGLAVLIPSLMDLDGVGICFGAFLTIVMGIMRKGCRPNQGCNGSGDCKCG